MTIFLNCFLISVLGEFVVNESYEFFSAFYFHRYDAAADSGHEIHFGVTGSRFFMPIK